jgi:hypothetical protein
MDKINDVVVKAVSTLKQGECFEFRYRGTTGIIFARPEGSDNIVAMPMQPREFFSLPTEDQELVTTWLDSFVTFSPATIGWAFKDMYEEVKFTIDGDREE